jgi:hypothetical protein
MRQKIDPQRVDSVSVVPVLTYFIKPGTLWNDDGCDPMEHLLPGITTVDHFA